MRFFYLTFFLSGSALLSYSQSPFTAESEGYYTIVGAFAVKENAANLNESLQKNGMNTSYGFLPSRNIYYVYALRSADVNVCIKEARELRRKPEFWDAWVRYIREDGTSSEVAVATSGEEPQPQTETPPLTQDDPVLQEELPATEPDEPVQTEQKVITLGNTGIFLSLINPQNGKVADGMVQVIDAERSRLIQEVKGNTYLTLLDPKSKSGNITLIVDVLGYRKIQKEINFNDPLADTSFITQRDTSLVAHFEMVRYHKGDIRTLYSIYFYNDAAVMMPESKYELNMLLDMMQENMNYKIKLHGHTNGNYHGKIIKVGKDGDFFSVAKDAETTVGSARELSESRAEVIKDWMVAQGIDASRIEVKAWGGKRPLYDKHSANAKKNIRVEVEVVEE